MQVIAVDGIPDRRAKAAQLGAQAYAPDEALQVRAARAAGMPATILVQRTLCLPLCAAGNSC